MARDKPIEVRLARSERRYIRVYADFFECRGITPNEKLVYIALKNFLDYTKDSGSVFPGIKTLCDITGLSSKTITEALKSLEYKGVIIKQRRGLTKSNLYILNDNPAMWSADTPEKIKALSESHIELTNEEMIAELERRGAIKIVKKEAPVLAATDQSLAGQGTSSNPTKHNTPKMHENQYYSEEKIAEHFNRDIMMEQEPSSKEEIFLLFNIIYDIMNTTSESIRIGSDEKPTEIVCKRIWALNYEHLLYVLQKYNEQGGKISNPRAYLIKMLYVAAEQMSFDIKNQVKYDGNI